MGRLYASNHSYQTKRRFIATFVIVAIIAIIGVGLSVYYGTSSTKCSTLSTRVTRDLGNCIVNKTRLENNVLQIAEDIVSGNWRVSNNRFLITPNDNIAYYLYLSTGSVSIRSFDNSQPTNQPNIVFKSKVLSHTLEPNINGVSFTYTCTLENPITFNNAAPMIQSNKLTCDVEVNMFSYHMKLSTDKTPYGQEIMLTKRNPYNQY